MKTPSKALFLICITLYSFLLSSCSGYHACALSPMDTMPKYSTKGFEITAKAFSGRDAKKYLGHNVLAKGYQPIQILLANHTEDPYLFTPEGLSLPTATAQEVANCVHESVILKVIGGIFSQCISLATTAIKAVTFFTMAFAIALPILFFSLDTQGKETLAIVAAGLIVTPGIVSGVSTAKNNIRVSNDYQLKTATEQRIEPHETFNAIIFVPKDDVQNSLSIKILNQRTNQTITLKTQVY